jgi:hypothetical protein
MFNEGQPISPSLASTAISAGEKSKLAEGLGNSLHRLLYILITVER